MKQETSNKPIIVVLGMHRSGTSLTTRALQVLGVDLGDHLIPPIEGDNDKGFWEDIDINNFDNALLEKLGSTWDRLALLDEKAQIYGLTAQRKRAVSLLNNKMSSAELFGFKDPRTAILLPFWKTVFQELGLDDSYVIVVRNPINVANSLLKRNEIPLEAGVLLWAKYMSGVLRHTQGKRRLVVDYDLMLESPSTQIKRIANTLNLPFDESSQQYLASFETEFLNRELCHHQASMKNLKSNELVPDYVKDAYEWVIKLAKDEVEFGDAELERFWRQFEEECVAINVICQYIDRLSLSVHKHENENRELSDKLLEQERSYMEIEAVRNRISEELEIAHAQLVQVTSEFSDLEKKKQDIQSKYMNALTEKEIVLSALDGLDQFKNFQQEYHAVQQNIMAVLTESAKSQRKIQMQLERQNKIVVDELEEVRRSLSEYKDMYQHAITECDDKQRSYEELHKAFKKAVVERDEVQLTSQNYDRENAVLRSQMTDILNSRSWRLTSGFRAIRYYLIKMPGKVLRRYLSNQR